MLRWRAWLSIFTTWHWVFCSFHSYGSPCEQSWRLPGQEPPLLRVATGSADLWQEGAAASPARFVVNGVLGPLDEGVPFVMFYLAPRFGITWTGSNYFWLRLYMKNGPCSGSVCKPAKQKRQRLLRSQGKLVYSWIFILIITKWSKW